MNRLRTAGKLLLLGLLVALAVPVGGIAYALWSGTGSGIGAASTGTTTAMTLSPATPTTTLYPGGSSPVVLTVSNPNDASIHITSLVLNTAQGTGGFSVDSGHAGCSVAALGFSAQTNGGAGWAVPARAGAVNGSLAITLTNALSMSGAAANACQGATFTVFLAAT